jgi:hypothetical protein
MCQQDENDGASSDGLSDELSAEEDDVFPPSMGEIKDAYPPKIQLATAQEYERRIHQLEQINATLRENISALYVEANTISERHEPIKPRRTTHMEISRDEAYETSIVPYEDPSVTEKRVMYQIDKLEKTNARLRWKLARQKLLVSQLSANLKLASDKMEDLTRSGNGEASNTLALLDSQSTAAIYQDQIQMVHDELQSVLHLISQNSVEHKKHTAKLLEVDMAVHRSQANEETVADKVQRVIRQLRGEQLQQSSSTDEQHSQSQTERPVTFDTNPNFSTSSEPIPISVQELAREETTLHESEKSSNDSWVEEKSNIEATAGLQRTDVNSKECDGEVEDNADSDLNRGVEEVNATVETDQCQSEKEITNSDLPSHHDNASDESAASSSIDSWHKDRDKVGRKSILEATIQYDDSKSHEKADDVLSDLEEVADEASVLSEAPFNTTQQNFALAEPRLSDYSNSGEQEQNPNSDECNGSDSSAEHSSVDSWHKDRDKVGRKSILGVQRSTADAQNQNIHSSDSVKSEDVDDLLEQGFEQSSSEIEPSKFGDEEVSSAYEFHESEPKRTLQDQNEIAFETNQDTEESLQHDNVGRSARTARWSMVKEEHDDHGTNSSTSSSKKSNYTPIESHQREKSHVLFDYSLSELIPSKGSPSETTGNAQMKEADVAVSTKPTSAKHIKRCSVNKNNPRSSAHASSMHSLSENSLKAWDEFANRTRKTMLRANKLQAQQTVGLSNDPLSARLSRRQLFQQRRDIAPLENNNERRQLRVLVRAKNGIDFVPPSLPPPLPSNNQSGVPLFKKGSPDGFYRYKSSSGNEYTGQWRDGKRHGFGTATVRLLHTISGFTTLSFSSANQSFCDCSTEMARVTLEIGTMVNCVLVMNIFLLKYQVAHHSPLLTRQTPWLWHLVLG